MNPNPVTLSVRCFRSAHALPLSFEIKPTKTVNFSEKVLAR
jgi:hypothetical protein